MKNTFNFNYFGLKVRIQSNNQLFTQLIKNKFKAFNKYSTYQFEKRKIIIEFSSTNFLENKKREKIVNSSTFINNNSLHIYHNYLLTSTMIETKFKGKDIQQISLLFKSSVFFNILDVLLRGLLKKQLFQTIIKLYIEQSLLWNLTVKHKLYCLHASSIEKDNKVTIFTGLNGVGKSTLALYLAQTKKYNLFSDNYLLINNKKAFFFPDSIRLSKKSLKLLSITPKTLFGFDKYFIESKFVHFSKCIVADIKNVYISYRGNKWNKKRMKKSDAQNTIHSLQTSNAEEVQFSPVSQFFPENTNVKLSLLKITYFELIMGRLKDLPYEF